MEITQKKKIIHAIYIGTLCSLAYLAVYFVRNVLGTVTPQMIENGFSEEYIGRVSFVFMIVYGVGQLINGAIGDKIKAKYMISLGLLFAGVTNFAFCKLLDISQTWAILIYGLGGFFLAMIYGPMTKVVAENTEPLYAMRCSLGYTLASFLGSPLAGIVAAIVVWQLVFDISSISMIVMGIVCFVAFSVLEKRGIVRYHQFDHLKQKGTGNIKVLIERDIIKYTIVSIVTGVIRTTVVFWMPTYFTQHLGYSPEQSAAIFSVATLVISASAFVAVFVFELLKRDMEKSMLYFFIASAIFFGLLYFVENPILNILCIVLAILTCNAATSYLFSFYCPSLRDTGMVSSATGFIDFVSYAAAAVSSILFANAVSDIGWGNLILVWCALMVVGILICLPRKKGQYRLEMEKKM